MTSGPRTVTANGVELCVETFGSPASPALLLIGGMAMSMDWWEDVLLRAPRGRPALRDPLRPARHRRLGRVRAGRAGVRRDGPGRGRRRPPRRSRRRAGARRGRLHGRRDRAAPRARPRRPGRVADADRNERRRAQGSRPPPTGCGPAWRLRRPSPTGPTGTRSSPYLVDDVRAYAGTLPFDEDAARALVGEGRQPHGGHRGEHEEPAPSSRAASRCCLGSARFARRPSCSTGRTIRCSRPPTARRSPPRDPRRTPRAPRGHGSRGAAAPPVGPGRRVRPRPHRVTGA